MFWRNGRQPLSFLYRPALILHGSTQAALWNYGALRNPSQTKRINRKTNRWTSDSKLKIVGINDTNRHWNIQNPINYRGEQKKDWKIEIIKDVKNVKSYGKGQRAKVLSFSSENFVNKIIDSSIKNLAHRKGLQVRPVANQQGRTSGFSRVILFQIGRVQLVVERPSPKVKAFLIMQAFIAEHWY